jgi:glycosyltransferase involved in cell wall biosynthesis
MSSGAAPGLALDLALATKSLGREVNLIVKSDNELMERIRIELTPEEITVVSFKRSIWYGILNLLSNGDIIFRKIESNLRKLEPIVIPMPGLFEYRIPKRLQEEFRIVTFMHDPSRHKGDLLPRNFMIKKLYLKSKELVYFSNYTRSELAKRYGVRERRDFLLAHPTPSIVERIDYSTTIHEKYLLLIGRNKKYQNFQRIVNIWKENEFRFPDCVLLIAGKGTSRHTMVDKRIKTIDKWLTDIEFGELVMGAEAILLPYREASQSGPASLAMGMGKKIIYSRVGGLPEQLLTYKCAQAFSSDSELIDAIKSLETCCNQTKADCSDWKKGWMPLFSFLDSKSSHEF